MVGGGGADTFRDTREGLNGDTIVDFSVGDKIIVADAQFVGFTFKLAGGILTYTGAL